MRNDGTSVGEDTAWWWICRISSPTGWWRKDRLRERQTHIRDFQSFRLLFPDMCNPCQTGLPNNPSCPCNPPKLHSVFNILYKHRLIKICSIFFPSGSDKVNTLIQRQNTDVKREIRSRQDKKTSRFVSIRKSDNICTNPLTSRSEWLKMNYLF